MRCKHRKWGQTVGDVSRSTLYWRVTTAGTRSNFDFSFSFTQIALPPSPSSLLCRIHHERSAAPDFAFACCIYGAFRILVHCTACGSVGGLFTDMKPFSFKRMYGPEHEGMEAKRLEEDRLKTKVHWSLTQLIGSIGRVRIRSDSLSIR
jgi:hypothetical protein